MRHFPEKFNPFKTDTTEIDLPGQFTFPFYYEPHRITKIAVDELQEYLSTNDLNHDFGLNSEKANAIGKMFGVLVVRHADGTLGYLAAFSGKLGGSNHHAHFVPPVYDILQKDGFYRAEELEISAINATIEKHESAPEYLDLAERVASLRTEHQKNIDDQRAVMRKAKAQRKVKRQKGKHELNSENYQQLCDELAEESISYQLHLKAMRSSQQRELDALQSQLETYTDKINALKTERAERSANLQNRLFDAYQFLNKQKKQQSLLPIFESTAFRRPPAGAGECAAPKLLQYAFKNDLEPIAMGEFWWGAPPKTRIRRHGHFYPACQGKCAPILNHMLDGMEVEENPLLLNYGDDKEISIVYEDPYIAVVDKPEGLLSVPGKQIEDSVQERMKKHFKNATGPIIVHRLDMSTSGLMVLAKNEIAYKLLQRQFLERSIRKKYLADLEGHIAKEHGTIALPMRQDVLDRPRQMVCHEQGKSASTQWQVLQLNDQTTRVAFYPITGRTHQLRVHAAHYEGLNAPIAGDDLYGKMGDRLHLHAHSITFEHPKTKKLVTFESPASF
ncbi:MAG: pseudouridine synthase [Bacteroidota bacterium]